MRLRVLYDLFNVWGQSPQHFLHLQNKIAAFDLARRSNYLERHHFYFLFVPSLFRTIQYAYFLYFFVKLGKATREECCPGREARSQPFLFVPTHFSPRQQTFSPTFSLSYNRFNYLQLITSPPIITFHTCPNQQIQNHEQSHLTAYEQHLIYSFLISLDLRSDLLLASANYRPQRYILLMVLCMGKQSSFWIDYPSKQGCVYNINIRKTTKYLMASIRTAFMQTYHSTNPSFGFLTTLPCIITSLLNSNDYFHSQEKEALCDKFRRNANPFQHLAQLFKFNSDRFLWIASFYTTSLHEIMDSNSSDFKEEREGGSFVHSLEVIHECGIEDGYDIKTVQSQVLSVIGNDPNSTEISINSQYDISDVEDI